SRLKEAKILLAPVPLYRRILRVHRSLPLPMRSLGDDYVKAEFRRHKDVENPAHLVGFVSQWQDVTADHSLFNGAAFSREELGKKIDSRLIDKLSDEQIGQLYELRNELK
ncbi:putative ACN9 family domain-containing protein, partial [Spinellus fusiger]